MYRFTRIITALVIAVSVMSFVPASAAPSQAGAAQTYIVLYAAQAIPADAAKTIVKAGGTLVASYDAIGVAIARSDNAAFRSNLLSDTRIENAATTTNFGVQLNDEFEIADAAALVQSATAGSWGDPLSSRQWDMVQIHVPEAHAITGGSPSVVVGDIDTGLDYTHPDLAPNVDDANSVNCVSGAPWQGMVAANDDNGHGTHTAGTIAAAANGIGIVGVAPNVKIAGIKAGNAAGFFFPEAVVCAFMWAGSHHLDVTNNSYFADPWLFNCRNDAEQRAIWKAEQRAIRYAMQQGVTVVAAMGNENLDLSKQNIDTVSPDTNPNPTPREVTNACIVIPVEIPGVIGVTANGSLKLKSYYSSYGVGAAQVVAPGGDRRFQDPGDGSRGFVLSTFPGNRYALAQGTSMASPHAAGVAALVKSQGISSPGAVAAMVENTADPVPCPPNPFNPGPPFNFSATCEGGNGYNGFYGHGQVNALSAVTHMP